jgi:hypothetical protein
MINTSKYISGEERKAKITELRKEHQPVFDALGEPDALFYPKLAYRPDGKDDPHMAFFVSELRRGVDIYTEFVGSNCDSEDPDRTLWKWNYNPHWEEEYDNTEGLDNGPLRYLVPVSELVKVKVPKTTPPFTTQLSIEDLELSDAPISEMTIRDLAAILLQKPVSTKQWLNDLLK